MSDDMNSRPAEIEEFRTPAQLESVRPAWERLRAQAEWTLGNDLDRFLVTVESLEEESPLVVQLRRDGETCALLVGRETGRRLVSPFGYKRVPLPELRRWDIVHGGLVTDGRPETDRAVLDHLLGRLRTRANDVLVLHRLRETHPLFPDLVQRARGLRKIEPNWLCRVVPGSLEETLAHHSAKHRSKLRRYDRKFAERFGGHAELRCYSEPEDVPGFFDATRQIAEESYLKQLGAGVFDTPLWRGIQATEARLGRLAAFVLFGGETPIAYQNGVIYGNRFLCNGRGYLPEHAHLRPGTILFFRLLQELCDRRVEAIDFGFGDGEYKQVYGTSSELEGTLRLFGRGARARTASAIDGAVAGAASLAKRGAARVDRLSAIKKRWRGRLRRGSGTPDPSQGGGS